MALTRYRLGELISQRREKYDGDDSAAYGVSSDGFISPKQEVLDKSLYNVFYKDDFVFNPARMELNSIAYNRYFDKAICSSLYEVFYINRRDLLLPAYLELFVKRSQFARLCKYIGWGSAREYCRIASIAEIELYLPSIDIQRKYVALYESMLANQRCYERGLDDLKLACDANLDKEKHANNPWLTLGSILREVDNRNQQLICTTAYGININKKFMASAASSEDLTKYKLVEDRQFAYSPMQTGRDRCIRIALSEQEQPIAVSPAYSVLEVKNHDVLPEYLMMWFSRSENDRRGWFLSDGSIRANLDLSRFFEILIPVPCMVEQMALVEMFKALELRKAINEQLKTQLKDICPILIKGSIEEASRH